MNAEQRLTLPEYLALQYTLNVVADEVGGFVLLYPDLPGCITQIETLDEVPAAADEIRELWIETQYYDGFDIPLPTYPEEYSGKFNLRIARSLHRRLAESAEREGVSLNQYVMALLDKGDALARIEQRLAAIESSAHSAGEPADELSRKPTGRARRSPASQAAVPA